MFGINIEVYYGGQCEIF